MQFAAYGILFKAHTILHVSDSCWGLEFKFENLSLWHMIMKLFCIENRFLGYFWEVPGKSFCASDWGFENYWLVLFLEKDTL